MERGDDEEPLFIRHATLIDSRSTKEDVAISEYFFDDFLDGEVVADNPNAISQILLDVIPDTASPFLENGKTKKDVRKYLKTKFSNETTSSFEDVVYGMSNMISNEQLNNKKMDFDSLSELAYNNAKLKNKTITKRFTAKVTRSPKTVIKDIKDSGKSIKISLSKKSINNNDVSIDSTTDDAFHIIKLKKSLVKVSEQN
ncbi:hypothetical protein [Tetragenococcus halophilus]|uniref:hypothetical protein n=1 Tax=Tetragenococcus halophilus TaxID=51669 RepID=UPI00300FF6DB